MKKGSGILIFSEENFGELHRVSYELLQKGKGLADELGAPIECLVMTGENIDTKELCYRGADTVYKMVDSSLKDKEEMLYTQNIVKFIEENKPQIVLIGATNFGRSIAPRIAAALKTGLTADCTDLKLNEEGKLIQIRPAFSDNLFAHIKTVTEIQMATVRYKEFEEAKRDDTRQVNEEIVDIYIKENSLVQIIGNSPLGEADITEAEVIVAGGRGIKKKEDLQLLEDLASVIGGKVGVSRALVDAGMANSSIQIGYSGIRVKPKIYIACGISGAPQHVAGMKEAEMIIAINSDPTAPIFKVANYGYVGDLYQVIPELIKRWKEA